MATSLLGLGLLLRAGPVLAQTYPHAPASPQFTTTSPYNMTYAPYSPYPPKTSSQAAVTPPAQPGPALHFSRDPQPIQSVAAVQAAGDKGGKDSTSSSKSGYDALEFRNLREVPGLEVLARLESEAALFERMRQESLRAGERIIFPDEPPLTKEAYEGRNWIPLTKLVEPAFVCHGRLLFEQPNLERGLWDFGILTPVLSAGKFYWDVAMLPYNLGTRPCQTCDCSAGKCLPGDPTPFWLYPVELSVTGLVAEAGVVTGVFFVFP